MLYGAAEFSRDTDLALFASAENITSLTNALRELHARRIAVPPFELHYLQRGHAIHFRSYHPDALNIRIDIMSVMRGLESFEQLWQRRARIPVSPDELFDVMSLADLVKAKKTQRDKDWPMIRRLAEADYVATNNPSAEQLRFWLLESRTPEMLIELSASYSELTHSLQSLRPLLTVAKQCAIPPIEQALFEEEKAERDTDRQYWVPLRKELEELRSLNFPTEEEV